jgi:hypothetical protein
MTLHFRLEAYNVLNRPNFSRPEWNILAGAAVRGQPANAPDAGFGPFSGFAGQPEWGPYFDAHAPRSWD